MTDPEFENLGSLYRFRWREPGVEIEARRVQERTNGIHAELTIAEMHPDSPPTLLARRIINLQTSKSALAKELGQRHNVDWEVILETLCYLIIEAWREGDPTVWLQEIEPRDTRWLVEPFPRAGWTYNPFRPR